MDTTAILNELEAERDRLDAAISALEGHRSGRGKRKTSTNGRPRHMSNAAKRKQSLAAKRRWREAKAAGKNRL